MAVIGLFAAEAETPYTQGQFSEERARYGISDDLLACGDRFCCSGRINRACRPKLTLSEDHAEYAKEKGRVWPHTALRSIGIAPGISRHVAQLGCHVVLFRPALDPSGQRPVSASIILRRYLASRDLGRNAANRYRYVIPAGKDGRATRLEPPGRRISQICTCVHCFVLQQITCVCVVEAAPRRPRPAATAWLARGQGQHGIRTYGVSLRCH